jgi:hypothetical protein
MSTSSRSPRIRLPLRRARLVLFAALALPVVACGVADADADVDRSVRCTRSAAGDVAATGTVTNNSSKASTYWVDIVIAVDGHEVDTRTAVAEDVAPGDSVPLHTVLRDAPRGAPSCEVGDVLRVKA